MERFKFWIFLGLGVTAALSLKFIGGADTDSDKWETLHTKAAFADDDSENRRALHARHVGSPFSHHAVAGLEPRTPMAALIAQNPRPREDKKDDKKVDSKKDPKKDAKKDDKKKDAKKKDAKKKKKDATKDGTPFGAPTDAAANPAETSSPFPQNLGDNGGAAGAGNLGVSANSSQATYASAAASSSGRWTLAEWEADLLREPNSTETQRFTRMYQSNSVTSEIFYAIINMMLEDNREAMRTLGVGCLSATPSVASLTLLVPILTTGTSAVQTAAQTALSAYTTLANLPVLKTILQSDSSLTPEALTLLTTSAQKNLSSTSTATVTASGTVSTASTVVSTATKQSYQAFVTILTSLASQGDATVKTDASSALTALNGLLNGAAGNAAAAKAFYSRQRQGWSS